MKWKKLSEENPTVEKGNVIAFWNFANEGLITACCFLGEWVYYDDFEGKNIQIQSGKTSESVDFGNDPLWIIIDNPNIQ